MKIKNYYASKNGECYAFLDKAARDVAVRDKAYTPLTASEAMKQFGYTDSCSCRVIKCIKVLPEAMPC